MNTWNFKDLTGQRFGRLVVVERNSERIKNRIAWKCKCDCGGEKIVVSAYLLSGHTKSCGCWYNENMHSGNVKHGKCHTRLIRIYHNMKQRCYDTKTKNYKKYGARGIDVCKEWRDDFITFYNWSMANGYQDNLSIDRIDGSKGYSPDNCRWVTVEVQNNNTSRNHRITYKNETHTVAEWAKIYNLSYDCLMARIMKLNWDIEKALTKPKQIQKKKQRVR